MTEQYPSDNDASANDITVTNDDIREIKLAPYGSDEHTPEEQLSPSEIISLKERLTDHPFLLGDLCAYMAFNVTLDGEKESLERKAAIEANGGVFASSDIYKSREDLALATARLAAHYAHWLQKAVSLEGSNWPDMSPPILFAHTLQEMDEKFGRDPEAPEQQQ